MKWQREPIIDTDTDEASWTLSFGDLMALLLVVFVLIAAMGDVQEGERFDTLSRSVRSAFGFPVTDGTGEKSKPKLPPLLAKLEQAGLQGSRPVVTLDDPAETWRGCDLIQEEDRFIIRLRGGQMFEPYQADLMPTGKRIVEWVAGYLSVNALRLEIRSYQDTQQASERTPLQDARDLAYERARTIADLMTNYGVDGGRIGLGAWTEWENRESEPNANLPNEASGYVDIIVHAVPTAAHDWNIADRLGS